MAGEATARQASNGAGPGPSQEDLEILAALDRGERRQATSLCARHHGATIGRFCMALVGSQHQADDLTQETLLRAHDSWDTYRREGSPRSWLLTIARRRCARHLERRDPRWAELHLVPAQEPLEEELLARYRRATRARRALQQLRPTDREALLLRYGFELTYEELASACAIEESAARQRVSRALVRLREVLGQEEQSHE